MKIDELKRILIIGAGTMGREIGLQCALYGYEVVLYDIAPAVREAVLPALKAGQDDYVNLARFPQAQVEAALQRITVSGDAPAAAAEVDLVCECVPEEPKLKGRVLGQFNQLCPRQAIFTTNTSTLLPSQFAKATGRPAQFAAMHFHTPVWYSNVVDLMPHPGTAAETMQLLEAFAPRIGQVPVVLKQEHNGYVFNAMLSAVNREAMTMAANQVASIEDIDRAWMGVMKMGIGPFGIMDLVGLDTVWHITHYWAKKAFWIRQLRKNADFVKGYLDRGYLGRKSGQGFYRYPNPAFQDPGFLAGQPSSEL